MISQEDIDAFDERVKTEPIITEDIECYWRKLLPDQFKMLLPPNIGFVHRTSVSFHTRGLHK